jgi:hypothetical protein
MTFTFGKPQNLICFAQDITIYLYLLLVYVKIEVPLLLHNQQALKSEQ